MVAKANPHHVEDFAFHKVGTLPDIGHGIHDTVILRHAGLHTNPVAVTNRIGFVHDFESLRIVRPIDGAHMDDVIEIQVGSIVHIAADIVQAFA